MTLNKNNIKKFLEYSIIALSAAFILYYLLDNREVLAQSLRGARWSYLIWSVMTFWLYFICRALGWVIILNGLDGKLKPLEGAIIWVKSEFTRYIPGNVWSFFSRVYLANVGGVSTKKTLISLAVEIILLVGSATLFIPLLVVYAPVFPGKLSFLMMLVSIPALIIILAPKVINYLANRVLILFKKEPVEFRLASQILFFAMLTLTAGWLFFGLGSVLAMRALIEPTSLSMIWLISVFVVAWLIGYLSIITPMGLGVREGAVIALLTSALGTTLSSATALISRFALVVSELIILFSVISLSQPRQFGGLISRLFIFLKKNRFSTALALAMSAYASYFGYYNYLRYYHFIAARFDLGIMDQVVYNTSQGRFFQLTEPAEVETISRFAVHADWFMVLIAPLYWIAATPATLIFLQSIIVATGAIPLYRLGLLVLKNRLLAFLIALGYLFYGPLQRAVIFDFHSVTLASAFLLWAFYFAYQRKWLGYFTFLILLISTKESMAFTAVTLGLYLWVKEKNWKVGLASIALGISWFYLLLYWIMPAARGHESVHFAFDYYSRFGDTPFAIIFTILTQPWRWVSEVASYDTMRYFYYFLLPTGLLPVLTPISLIAMPELALNILSDFSPMREIDFQYTAAIAPVAFLAIIFGLKNALSLLQKLNNHFVISWRWEVIAAGYLAIVATWALWRYSPLPLMYRPNLLAYQYRLEGGDFIRSLAKEIPSSAVVSATTHQVPHFSRREYIYPFPLGIERSDYLIIELGRDYEIRPKEEIVQNAEALRNDQRFELIFDNGKVLVFKRIFAKN